MKIVSFLMEKNMGKLQIGKLLRVIIGSLIMGVGIAFTIWANVGSDPMTLFWIGISNTLSITVGQANILVCAIILVFVFFMDKKQIHIGSILNPIVIALTTDFMTSHMVSIDSLSMSILLCVVGLLVLALGIAIYALADYGKGAYEALVFCVSHKTKRSIGIVRTLCDITFAILGILLGATGALGTLLAIICMGTGIQFFIKKLSKNS
ncbi:MAG: YitT family protein [Longicatena sp.]